MSSVHQSLGLDYQYQTLFFLVNRAYWDTNCKWDLEDVVNLKESHDPDFLKEIAKHESLPKGALFIFFTSQHTVLQGSCSNQGKCRFKSKGLLYFVCKKTFFPMWLFFTIVFFTCIVCILSQEINSGKPEFGAKKKHTWKMK